MNLASSASSHNADAHALRKLMLARNAFASAQAPWFYMPYGNPALPPFPPLAPQSLAAVQRSCLSSSDGLDLLRGVSRRLPNTVAALDLSPGASSPVQKPKDVPPRESEDGKFYIDEIMDSDVLCGRGGKSNHHPGNKRYRQVVSEMKMMYKSSDSKKGKTGLSRAIVDHVCDYGGRFVKKDEKSGRYFVLTKAAARTKTSQALRETKSLKWTN